MIFQLLVEVWHDGSTTRLVNKPHTQNRTPQPMQMRLLERKASPHKPRVRPASAATRARACPLGARAWVRERALWWNFNDELKTYKIARDLLGEWEETYVVSRHL